MNVKAFWDVQLPVKFNSGYKFKPDKIIGLKQTTFTPKPINIDDCLIEMIKDKNNGFYESVKIITDTEYDDNFLPVDLNRQYLSEFMDRLERKTSNAMQLFLDGFSYATNDEYYQITDGQDFITRYTVRFEQPEIAFEGSRYSGNQMDCRNIDDEDFEKSVIFANREKTVQDNAWYLLRDAEHFLWNGKYALSVLNMAMTIEMLIKSRLSKYLDSKDQYLNDAKKQYKVFASLYSQDNEGESPTFAAKYIEFGLKHNGDPKISEDEAEYYKLINSLNVVFHLRNKIVHGLTLSEAPLMKEWGIDTNTISELVHSLFLDTDTVYRFLINLK